MMQVVGDGEINWHFDLDLPPLGSASAEPGAPRSLPFSRGSVLDDAFELLEQLGRGGQGVVFRARDRRGGREVAVKLMNRTLTPCERERFRREGELTASLTHSGIVTVHASGEAAGVPYLVYELVEDCRALTDLLEAGDRDTLVRAVRDAAAAVGFAHRNGVVHRDLKPDNLLIDSQGRVRVADFGLARAVDMETLTRSGDVVGTPWYMAPEQFDGAGRAIGPPADVWALGVVLYRCLTGEPPFKGPSLVELMSQAISQEVAPRREAPSISRDLEAVCLRALRKAPAARYPDAAALAEDLSLVLEGLPPSVVARSHKPWLGVALASGGLLALAFAGGWALRTRADGEASPAPAPSDLPAQPDPVAPSRAHAGELLRTGLREAALARQGEDPRIWRSERDVVTPAAWRARARASLNQALECASPASPEERRARLALARLLGPSAGEALLAPLSTTGDPEALLLEARGELARDRPREALSTLLRLPDALQASARGQLVRAAASLEVGDLQEALRCAEASSLSQDADLGSYPALRGLLARLRAESLTIEQRRRVSVLSGLQDPALTKAIQAQIERWRVRNFPPPKARREHDRLLRESPYSWELRFLRGRGLVVSGQTAVGTREWILACARCPRLFDWLRFDLKQLRYMREVLGEEQTVDALLAGLQEDTWLDRAARSTLTALHAEFEGDRSITEDRADLDRCLDEAPGLTFLRLVRASVLLRTGLLDEAEEDLHLVAEVFPDSPQLAFFRALLLARRHAPLKQVVEQIQRAERLGCREWRQMTCWDPDDYPEMSPYKGAEGLAHFFAKGR